LVYQATVAGRDLRPGRRINMQRVLCVVVAGVGLSLLLGLGAPVDAQVKKKGKPKGTPEQHDPARAVGNLDVHKDLQATLFASEAGPDLTAADPITKKPADALTNPTNIDVDHRGRVWVCDVKNYRGHNGERPAGDRILIYEDTDGDGKAD